MSVVFKTLISRITNRYGDPQITEYQTRTIPTTTRQHIAHQIEESLDDRSIVDEVDCTIDITRTKLDAMEDSEIFLDSRIRKYRKMLAEHQIRLHSEESGMDNAQKQRHLEQQEKFQLQICDVIDTHKNILQEVEILRRKLREIEGKRDEMTKKRDCMEEFLISSAKLDLEDNGFDAADVGMEMGVLNRIEPSQLEIS